MKTKLHFHQTLVLRHIGFLPFAVCLYLFAVPKALAQKPELVVQTGHIFEVSAIAISPDGRTLASQTMMDPLIKLWDLPTGKEFRTLYSPSETGQSYNFEPFITFHPNGRFLLSVVDDKQIKIWDVETGRVQHSLAGNFRMMRSASFSPTGDTLAIASAGFLPRLLKVSTGSELEIPGQFGGDDIRLVRFSPNGKMLASVGKDSTIKLWHIASEKKVYALAGHDKEVTCMAFSPNSQILATGSSDKQIILWNTNNGQKLHILKSHTEGIKIISFSPNGQLLASGGWDKTIKLWNLTTGKLHNSFPASFGHSEAIIFRPELRILVCSFSGNTINVWDAQNGHNLQTFRGLSKPLFQLCFSSDGKGLAATSWEKKIRLWDLSQAKAPRLLTDQQDLSYGIGISNNSELLASGDWNGGIQIWQLKSGKRILSFNGHRGMIYSCAFSPDDRILASCGKDGAAKLWEVATGKAIRTLIEPSSNWVQSVAFSPDGKFLACGSWDNIITLWNVSRGLALAKLTGHKGPVQSVSFHPSGQIVASGSRDGTIRLWHVNSGKEIGVLTGHTLSARSVDFSPDGRFLASGSYDGNVRIWEVVSQKQHRLLAGHASNVLAVDFHPSGRFLASACQDGTIKLWYTESGEEMASFVAIDSIDWLVSTPEHFYMSSRNAFKGVAFRVGKKIYPVEQFDLRLNRPDLVLQNIGVANDELVSGYRQVYHKRLQKLNFTEERLNDDFHLPKIAITNEAPAMTARNKVLQFKIKVSDSKYLLDRLNVYVNDVPIYGSNGIDLRNKKIQTHEQDISLELSAGRNKIQVSVLNDKGTESLRETFEVMYDGKPAKPDLYLIAIGVSEYVDSRYNLTYAAKDADDLAALLESQKDRFNRVYTFKLLSRNATKENILQLRDTLMQSKVDDEVILFVAGHGLLDKNFDYYFATTDIDFANPSERALPYDALEGLLDGIPARKKLLLMDTCHSGEIDKEDTVLVAAVDATDNNVKSRSFRNVVLISQIGKLGLSNSFVLMQELFANLSRGAGAVVISAASGIEYAYEDQQWQNGVFTYCMLEGLKTRHADLNKDGEIRVAELKDYVTEKVQKLTQGRQTPTSRRENSEFDFRVF